MKKFFLALLTVVCLTCAGLALASCKGASYYTLYFYTAEGANVVCEIPSGYEVKSGYKVTFRVELDEDAHGEPKVEANGDELVADSEGFYSFKMKENTAVRISGVYATGRNLILFDKGDKDGNAYRVTYNAEYVDDNGVLQTIDTENAKGTQLGVGTEVTFTIDVSVYYGENPEYEVVSNTQVIEPQSDGKYHVTIDGKRTIAIQGLELDDSFVGRKDGDETYLDGNGTESDPFRIRKPIDLYVMASFMNTDFYHNRMSSAYYSLENDIDLKGEELFIIGASDTYYFGGNFNGNGHKISNYYISATAIDQNDFNEGFMPNIGLFGVAVLAQIYDLNIENFTYEINAAPWDTPENKDYNGFFAGGVVAYGMGVNITNCSVKGKVTAAAGNDKFGYIGGVIGFQMSAVSNDGNTRYYSTVRSCSTDVTIVGTAGCVYAAGGIAGAVRSYDESTSAMILNSYSDGDIEGAMRTGGIAGLVYPYGSVTNCYATGYVDGYTRLGNDPDYGDFRYAYAGGIAGEIGYDCVVANSFFTGEVTARSAAGANYAVKGEIAGFAGKGGSEGGEYIETESGLVYNCVSVNDKDVTINDGFIKNVLGWSEGDWTFSGNGLPAVNKGSGSNSFVVNVTLKGGTVNGADKIELNVQDAYYPMSYWYAVSEELPQFIDGDGGLRSFGYYFDGNLTEKVPAGYVPTSDVDLYAGLVNYGEVAGKYYLQWKTNGSGKYIELGKNGELIYRDGALISETYYYYDGATVTMRDTYLAIIDGQSQAYSSFKATVDGGVMTIWDNQYYPAVKKPLKALKETESFEYGKYYGINVDYTFNSDGTGLCVSGGIRQNFTYSLDGSDIAVKMDGSVLNGTVSGGKVTAVDGVALTPYDKFEGVWEKSAGSHKQYTFDGKGGWSYVYYGYENGAVKELDKANGSYTATSDGIQLNNGKKFSFNAEGNLMLGNEVYYYKQYSYAGIWNNFARQSAIEIELNGITSEGFGGASINFGAGNGKYDLTYDAKIGNLSVVTGTDPETKKDIVTTYENKLIVYLYRNDLLVAELMYREDSLTLWGNVYEIDSGNYKAQTFYLYDDFRGDWISDGYEITFNGLGNYNVQGNNDFVAVRGTATVNGVSATYELENNTLTGKLTAGGNTYNLAFDEESGKIKVTGHASFELQQRDKWYRVKLVDASGNVYSFDGKGNLSGGGVMTVTAPDGSSTTKSYTASAITVSGSDYKYGSTTLYVYNQFTGEWYVSNSYGEKLVIGNFNALNEAEGTYFGSSYKFTYYPEGNYVTITDPADASALPLYINVLDGGDVTELAVGTANGTEGLFSVCIKEGFDEFKGDYSYDGGKLTLDGFGKSVFTDGAARYVKGNETVETFTYRVDEFNQVLLHSDKDGLYYIFFESDNGVYEAGGKKFAKVLPDNLYTVKATDENGVLVSFYGNGIAKDAEGGVYEYKIEKQDTTLMEYILTMTREGETETYVLDYSTYYDPLKDEYYTLKVK